MSFKSKCVAAALALAVSAVTIHAQVGKSLGVADANVVRIGTPAVSMTLRATSFPRLAT